MRTLTEREWPSPAGPQGLVKAGKTDAKSTAKIGTSSSRSVNVHYEISPREREDEAERDRRDFGTQEYDDDAQRPDQREVRRDYE